MKTYRRVQVAAAVVKAWIAYVAADEAGDLAATRAAWLQYNAAKVQARVDAVGAK